MCSIRRALHHFLILSFLSITIATMASAQRTAPALYRAATGDAAPRCVYVIFTFSEKSCLTCQAEIGDAWCPGLNHLSNPARAGAVMLFNSPRLEVADRMRERLKSAGCTIPFIVDTNGTLSARLFQSDAAGQVIVADAAGTVLTHRDVGEDDAFARRYGLDHGGSGLTNYLDSLIGRCATRSGNVEKSTGKTRAPGMLAPVGSLRVLDSVELEGSDTVEMPFAFIYSPADRMYAYVGGMTHVIYMHDSTGRRLSMLDVGKRMNPISIAIDRGRIFAIGGEQDTTPVVKGKDTARVVDEVITLAHYNATGRKLARWRLNPISSLSLANDISLGAHNMYLTTQRTATASYVYNRGIDFDHYLAEVYDPRTYPAYIDTMKIIREYDSAMNLRKTYGALPSELAKFGATRTHFWLEYQRWVRELPNGEVAFLHSASPILKIYGDGELVRTIDLRGKYYRQITGKEIDGKIPRYAGLIAGEDGRIYCQYMNPDLRKAYVVAVSPLGGRRGAVEIGWNDHLLRVDAAGRLHLARSGRHLQLLVAAPIPWN
ncbi:MAG: hypothetical protein JWQ98_2251 [Chlorobi bacterium]|nr:hypothetical protein [Chlorobiota bacterium]